VARTPRCAGHNLFLEPTPWPSVAQSYPRAGDTAGTD
jgi:hypothetical protein